MNDTNPTFEIEIDGQVLEAQPGETIIQVADKAGIYIPRFCYHKKLSIAASCRMCLVEVEKAPKTLPACATPVMAGMKVSTRSEKALFSQKTVMEFLLINHPLDCPICDQGGECELQDLSLGYGSGISRFTEGKRAVHDENLGPLISTEMTRCIQCTRCVRFGDEVAGLRELGMMGRGEELEIATYVEKSVRSELSGNMIDICPVGALTSKPYRFTARAWELAQSEAIAPHDCLGSHIYIHTRGEEYSPVRHVMRVVPRENESINETWLSDRDRFSYEGIHHPDRVFAPCIKRQGEWITVDWETALTEVVQRLQKMPAAQIGALISPSATTEEAYLLQKWIRALGSDNIDHRLRQTDFRNPHITTHSPSLELPLTALDHLDRILLVGSNLRFEQPLASQRIRKAVKQGGVAMSVNPADYALNFAVTHKCIAAGTDFVRSLSNILKAMAAKVSAQSLPADWLDYLATLSPSETEIAIAEQLLSGERSAILLGAYATQHPDAALIHLLSRRIASLSKAAFGVFTEGANSAGLSLARAMPTTGLDARAMFETPLQAYVLWGVEPELDSAYPAAALAALEQASCVISFSAFRSPALESYADVILPIALFAETAGTYINLEGKWQSMQPATLPPEGVKTGWQVLCDLGKVCGYTGFEHPSAETICAAAKEAAMTPKPREEAHYNFPLQPLKNAPNTLYRIGQWPLYRIDSLVRHAAALQATIEETTASIRIHPDLAARLQCTEGQTVTAIQNDTRVTLPLALDTAIPDNHVWIPAGLEATAGFGEMYGEVVLEQ